MNNEPPHIQLALPTVESPSTFCGLSTLAILWACVVAAALSIAGIHALDSDQGQFGFPESPFSQMVRIACALGLWAGFSIRFACTGPIGIRVPASKVTTVFLVMLAIGFAGLGLVFAPLALVRIGLSRLPRGIWRTLAFVVFSAVAAFATLLFMEFFIWLSKGLLVWRLFP